MKRIACAFPVLLAVPAGAAAQLPQDTFRLGAVVVTAARIPTPIASAPGAVTVISGESMRARGTRFVADALRTAPGVAVAQTAGPGSLTSVFMRGGESDYVLVLVDGVQVNDAGGTYNWAHLRTEDVERIEIVRGPSSVLYGSDAVAGVVHIITRAGGPPRVSASIGGDRGDKHNADAPFYTRSYDASVAGTARLNVLGRSELRYGATAAHVDADGLFEYNSDYDNTAWTARAQLANSRFDIGLSGQLRDNEFHYPTSGSGALADRNQFAVGDARTFGLEGGVRLTSALDLRVLAANYETDTDTHNPSDAVDAPSSVNETWLSRRSIDARINASLPLRTTLTVGAERESQHGTTRFESVSEFGTFADSSDNERDNTGFYAQLHATPLQRLTLTLGARLDDNSAFGNFTTARAALSWSPIDVLRVRAAVGSAFKEPTFFENFATGFTRGNPDLEPERSRSWEIGGEYIGLDGAVTLGATWFDQRFRDLIQYSFNTPTPETPNYMNVGEARSRGLEVSARALHERGDAHATYTYTGTKTIDQGIRRGPGVPSGRAAAATAAASGGGRCKCRRAPDFARERRRAPCRRAR